MSEPQTPHPASRTARALAASLAVFLLLISQLILLALPDGTVAGILLALAGGFVFIAFALREPPAREGFEGVHACLPASFIHFR